MATTLTCPSCGAPVRWKGDAPVVECRYCSTHVSTGTGKTTAEPAVVRSQMRPRNVAVVTLLSIGLPIVLSVGGVTLGIVAESGGPGGYFGPSLGDLAVLTMDAPARDVAAALDLDSDDEGYLVAYLRKGSPYDYVVFNWDDEYPDHIESFGFHSSEANDQMPVVVQWLRFYLGRRLTTDAEGALNWRWAAAQLWISADMTTINYSASPGDDPHWKYRTQLMWSVILASSLGQDLGLDSTVRKQWLATGYTVAEVGELDITMDVDRAKTAVVQQFPGTHEDLFIGLSFEIPLDHPWFRSLEVEWRNEKGGRMTDADLWPSLGHSEFPHRLEIVRCLEAVYGDAEEDVVDHLKGDVNYEWDPSGLSYFRLHDHMLAIYAWESGWRNDNAPSHKAWRKLMRTLDGCGG